MRSSKNTKTKVKRKVKAVRLLSKPEVLDRVEATFPSVWKWMQQGRFPRSRDVDGETRWLESEIDEWILSRPIKRLKGDIVKGDASNAA
jgi:predicted DNA-binding transcriptional regulator AlpA